MSRKQKRGIALPWERRGAWLRQLLAGPRWKIAVVLVVLISMAYGLWRSAERRSRERLTHVAIADVQRAITDFRSDVGRCPRSMTELVHPPRSRTRYLREVPRDGWSRQLWVRCPGHDDPDGADVISAGPSGSFFNDDNLQ